MTAELRPRFVQVRKGKILNSTDARISLTEHFDPLVGCALGKFFLQ